jgi:hypothetical protein
MSKHSCLMHSTRYVQRQSAIGRTIVISCSAGGYCGGGLEKSGPLCLQEVNQTSDGFNTTVSSLLVAVKLQEAAS